MRLHGVKPYLQLVRLPNLFTAAADPLAGWLFIGGTIGNGTGWGPLAASGVASYAAGMVLNDVFDYRVDLEERPSRPLPSGRVSRRVAAGMGCLLLAAGPAVAALVGTTSLIVSIVLTACILSYDAGFKRTLVGPVAMGVCRALNLLLGMSHDDRLGGPAGWLAAGAFGLFVVGVTCISRDEVTSGRTRGVVLGMVLENLGMLGVAAAGLGVFALAGGGGSRPIVPIEGLLVLLVAAWIVNLADGRALREPTPGRLQAAVKTGVLSLVWLDVGLVASVAGIVPAMAVALLWLPAFVLGKWLYST